MSAAPSFTALLAEEAARAPDQIASRFFDLDGAPTGTLSRGDLHRDSLAIGRGLVAAQRELHGAGAPVLVCAGPGADHTLGLFGAWAAGATAVPVYPPGPRNPDALDTLAVVARASGARLLLAPPAICEAIDGPLRARLGEAAPTLVPLDPSVGAARGDEPSALPPAPGADDAALLMYTSGSTGDPKGAVLTHGGLLANMRAIVERCVPGAAARICLWLPQGHIAGLYTRLLPLVAGGEVAVLPPEAFSRRPATWLELMARQGSRYTIAPDFAYALVAGTLDDATVARLDLSAWTMAVCGGERVRPSTFKALFDRLAPTGVKPTALHPYYGMTESLCNAMPQGGAALHLQASKQGLFFGRLRAPRGNADAQPLIGHGPPMGEGTEIVAVHPTGGWRLPPRHVGELWTRGPSIIPRYHDNPAQTEASLRATLDDGTGPWLRTGDLGFIHQGQIFVTGRCKELLIVRGKNHYPQDLEATVLRATGLPEGAAAAFTVIHDGDEALGLAVEVPDAIRAEAEGLDRLVRAARREVASAHGLMIAELYLVPVGALPRTATDKIAREQCRRLAVAGAWDASKAAAARQRSAPQLRPELSGLSGEALRQAILGGLVQILSEGEAGQVTDRQLDGPLAELGLSSLEMARLAMELRRLTGIEVPFSMLWGGAPIRALAQQIFALVEAGERPADAIGSWRRDVRELAASLPNRLPPRRSREGAILMTGATGYLGSYLLASLLRAGDREIRCLVRAPDAQAGLARLEAALREGPGWEDAWRRRLTALPGDLLRPHLGLDDATWAQQVDEVAILVHNAANVNFVSPYSALRATNVAPVHPLIELAIAGGSCKTVHQVGTLAVFNATFRREQRLVHSFDRLLKPDHLYSGYAQSKWVAEACFRIAGARGIPMGIHRPGVITGDSKTGHTNVDDFLCRFILGCVAMGAYPDTEVELDLVAVDDVAEGIALAVYAPTGTGDLFIETFHWSHPRPVLVRELMGVYQGRGYPMEAIPLQDWLGRLRAGLPTDNPLFAVHPFLLEVPAGSDETILEFMDGLPHTIDRAEAETLRAAHGLTQRAVDRTAMGRMAEWLERSGHLRPPRNP